MPMVTSFSEKKQCGYTFEKAVWLNRLTDKIWQNHSAMTPFFHCWVELSKVAQFMFIKNQMLTRCQ
jgi:hypothetical protein